MLTARREQHRVSESPALLRRGTGTGTCVDDQRDSAAAMPTASTPASSRHDDRLDELPPDEVPAARADRMAHRDVARAAARVRARKRFATLAQAITAGRRLHRAGSTAALASVPSNSPRAGRSRGEPRDDLGYVGRTAVLFGQPARDQIELCDQRVGFRAGLERARRAAGRTCRGDLRLTLPTATHDRVREPERMSSLGKSKSGRHDADDCARCAGDRVASPEHVRIAGEPLHPERRGSRAPRRRPPTSASRPSCGATPSVSNSDSDGLDIRTRLDALVRAQRARELSCTRRRFRADPRSP